MSEGKRSRLSLAQRSEIWRRWKAGQSLHEIGRAFGKPHSCIRCLLLPRGGIAPAVRRRQTWVRCLTNALIAHMGNCVGGSRVLVWSEST
jgi:hypothetical protein